MRDMTSFPLLFLISAPFSFITSIFSVILGFYFTIRFFPTVFGGERLTAPFTTDQEVRTAVHRVIHSDVFFTTLNEALPVGNDDAAYGLDFIPFMLSSILERRKRAARAARFSLIATIVLGAVFTAVVMYYGYTLVHEPAPGLPRVLADLTQEIRIIEDDLVILLPGALANPVFAETCAPELERLRTIYVDSNPRLARSLNTIIDAGIETGDISALADSLRSLAKMAANDDREATTRSAEIVSVESELREFLEKRQGALARLHAEVKRVEAQRLRAEVSSSDDRYRLTDLVKRVALGVVVSVFLLAILRWIASIYRSYQRQTLTADSDELLVRQFYVAFKASSGNNAARTAVLGSFLRARLARTFSGRDSFSLSREETSVVKELIALLQKKL
jgi:hypothetical protein